MTELLLLLITITACFVNRKERFPALIFGLVDCFFYYIGADIEGGGGYVITSLFDAFTALILYIAYMHTQDKLSGVLIFACALSVLINIYGFAAYIIYESPFIYNTLFEIYYISIILLFISRMRGNASTVAGYTRDNRRSARIFDCYDSYN